MNYRALAQLLGAQGRYGDTELVHVTKREKEMLRRAGGSGTTNPITGLDEYYEMGSSVDSSNNPGIAAGIESQSIGVDDTGTSIVAGGLSDIGPEIEVGPNPFGTGLNVGEDAPSATIEAPGVNTALPSFWDAFTTRLGDLYGNRAANLALGAASTVAGPYGALASHGGRAALAGIQAIRDVQGLPEPAPTPQVNISELAGGGDYELSQLIPQYMGMNITAPAATPPTAAAAPMQYKGLEPYMRDYLRRQGIFV